MIRLQFVVVMTLVLIACSGRTVSFDEEGVDGGLNAASDAARSDSGAVASGSSPSSCGANDPVDCTEFGDGNASCVDSSHCSCSLDDNYKCEGASDENGAECTPGVVCVVRRGDVVPSRVGNSSTSCGDPEGQGLIPIDCTRYGDLNAGCVFGNHCMCRLDQGFECANSDILAGTNEVQECNPGVYCVPVDQ